VSRDSLVGITTSNMRRHSSAKKGRRGKGKGRARSHVADIATEAVQHDHRTYSMKLQENERGRVLYIVEQSGARASRIMVPCPVATIFVEVLERLAQYEAMLPPHETASPVNSVAAGV
jgi:hypothetical protein